MDQTLPASVDVLLTGMGPVGATAANLLGRLGLRTLVIDKETGIFMAPRAIVLDNEALRILQMAGLEEGAFATRAIAEVQMRSPLFGDYARANTSGQIDGHPQLVTFHQPELERVLRERLARHACVQTALGAELVDFTQDEQGVRATVRQADGALATVQSRFLVGADGASSFVRRHLGLGFEGKTFTQDWLVVDVRDPPVPLDRIEFSCDPSRPSPHMPAPGNRQRWEFMLHPGETRERMEHPDMIRALLAPWCDARDCVIERTAVYRFHARLVDRFSRGRVFLAGDAAHITPPFVGQGLVAGLRDVANLCWKLAWVAQGRAPLSMLDSYDAERRPHARAIINMARQMGALVMPRNRATALLVHGLMNLLHRFPLTRPVFEELKFKPSNRFRRGLFQRGRGGARLARGAPLPQGWLREAIGAPALPSDERLAGALSLVGFGCDPAARLDPSLLAAWRAAGGQTVALRHRGQAGLAAGALEDMSDTLVPGAAPVGWVAAVRPDCVVLHDGPLAGVDAMVRETLALLGRTAPAAAPLAHALTG
ncbi:bifunctional 3-(3-hydroxy-phenyl)propionate/3-hydroxycinnamic acid hydroxylase [Pseudoduganella namucuonensis]|uniref:3-(3-hydroxy-phenyl)propionate hydroxylase n=1 Tax=Pseudoduganella namucuonensis TaxID=1035707 RepID=A0A1I7LMW9_9BURK|nr:bifunctional 3-(3-hydroxy-phenyl)propionate/3-hydroxycinnamic acid hydroxylase [Pseudoduganella namucuonensis]SFV11057.1 3-(3-hydroxy-phenyl)propionate hydroxylase [Pseudoduganella namucuonensis]